MNSFWESFVTAFRNAPRTPAEACERAGEHGIFATIIGTLLLIVFLLSLLD
ncbi:MAG: hypothetical protein IJ173_02135 [Kiritimatiellae bacterium]|nr:hypothetical protein [Kiritimatiellia bacterium]